MKKLILILFMAFLSVQVYAQKSKIPVGVKSYTYYDETALMYVQFKDFDGTFDVFNLDALSVEEKQLKFKIVFDDKNKIWRLPLTVNEVLGADGIEPLRSSVITLGQVSYAIRQKID